MKEIWRDCYYNDKLIPNYKVSNYGRVYNCKTGNYLSLNPRKGKQNNGGGYVMVYLSVNNKVTRCYVHILVANAFIPNVGGYYTVVDHKDTCRTKNIVTNLVWTSTKGNSNNPKTVEKYRQSKMGSKNPNKGIPQHPKKVMNVTTGKVYDNMHLAAEDIGASSCGSISNCCKGRQQHAYGYVWKYVD